MVRWRFLNFSNRYKRLDQRGDKDHRSYTTEKRKTWRTTELQILMLLKDLLVTSLCVFIVLW